ncbi:MAG: carbon-monoxide dehydrogenase large subunit [Acidobacteriaceae bacterium]|nr:carbon-monoxide dehydrogenase large subunit [Acidobacteriaceae bacterium]MBV8570925.1 carbon-monoxide dehydrogenase large subunit [Acidobacteriaceae bacterium]
MIQQTSPEIGGMGHSVKRKEDRRFLLGKGNYVDDIHLPHMVYGQLVRSPFAHALIKSVNTEAAMRVPGVLAVITGEDLAKAGLAWMPTLFFDKQMVLATGKVLFQSQEVAFVVAETRFAAADAAELVEVDYEELPVLVDPHHALDADAPILRPDREEKSNHIFHWEVGDRAATAKAFEKAPVRTEVTAVFQRCHPAPLETCGCVADFNTATERLTVWLTSQAPHAHRTLFALVGGIPENNIRVISPDIGGGFGNKVPIYPGYVCAVVASLKLGRPVKWVETRSENLQSTGFARDYHMRAEIASESDGTVKALRVQTLADHGAFNAAAQPTKFPAGLFSICTGSYKFPNAFCEVDGVYTNKAPGGIAYRCSFRVTEASYLIERAMDVLAYQLNTDPAELRLKNFIRPDEFPYETPLGWSYDSGNYAAAMNKALEIAGYRELRKEQEEKRRRGELMGIGLSSFTEVVGAGPAHTFDIAGLKMFDSCEIRIHPTGKAIARLGTKSQGQGHETTFPQIIAQELGIPVSDITLEEGDTDTAPYGLGTYASRSTPVAGGATSVASRKIREKARKIAAHLLEVSEEDLEWEPGKFFVKGAPSKAKTIQEIAFAAYTNIPPGMEAGLEAVDYYDPPNLTFPFGTYICVVDIDKGTGEIKVRRFIAVDDCGNIINPMIVEGQIHGGLAEGLGIAFMQLISYDESGNVQGGNFMDYLLPTAVETPYWETDKTCTPSPHHPIGAKGVGESPNVGSPAAFVNAVVDALSHLGVRHIDMPIASWKVWQILKEKGVAA